MRGVGVAGHTFAEDPAGDRAWWRRPAQPRLARGEVLLLAAFAAISVWVVSLNLWQVVVHGRLWTGTDGIYITDQMQYLSWVVSASHTGLIADLFVVRPTSAVYLQPAFLVSGALAAVGVPAAVALLIWKPIAVGAFFLATRALIVRALPAPGLAARLAALALALFYGCFSSVYGQFSVVGDLFPGFLSWGYPFALMAVAAAVYGVLAYDRARAEGAVRWAPGLLGALAGSLHPWQGELFVLLIAATELAGGGLRAELARGLRSQRLRLAAATLALAAVPLIYYVALGKLNINWKLGQVASKHQFPLLAISLALAPLAIGALWGVRRQFQSFLGRALILWTPICFVIYAQAYTSQGATPLHAFDGVTLPLAVLAVTGWTQLLRPRHRLRRVLAVAAVGALTIPTTYYEMRLALESVAPHSGNPNFIRPAERRALAFLKASHDGGGVISSVYLGMTIPVYTGRHTYDGDCIWSEPDCNDRDQKTAALLAGRLTPTGAQDLVSESHARFVLLACGSANATVEEELRPLATMVRHFGCASVIEVRPPAGVIARS